MPSSLFFSSHSISFSGKDFISSCFSNPGMILHCLANVEEDAFLMGNSCLDICCLSTGSEHQRGQLNGLGITVGPLGAWKEAA